ncbi:MAG: ABC transporter permease [Bryobacteraceae bacterium]
MQILWQDLRYAARVLRRTPGFTALAILILALGIGATSAIFSLVDATILRPLPFTHPADLVMLYEHAPGYAFNRVSPLNFLDWHDQNRSFSTIAAISGGSRTLTTNGAAAERIPGQAVTSAFFDVLGIKPIAGRFFTDEDNKPGASMIVMSERIWRSRFGADPNLVGSTIRLDGEPVTVIGIAPASFEILFRSDLWSLFLPKRSPEQRRMHYLSVVARRKPAVTIEQARADMGLIAEGIARISPETNKGWGVTVNPLHQGLIGDKLRTTSLVLAGSVGFILLMACANVANLLLARGALRAREIVVRASIGGSRARIFRQLLTESLLLATIGGVAGIALARLILGAADSILPPDTLPTGLHLTLDARVLSFAVVLTVFTGILFGLAPAWQATRLSLAEALRAGGRTATGSGGKFRAALAVAEVAAAVLLVTGSGLLFRTILQLQQVDPGFKAEKVLTMSLGLPFNRYKQDKLPAFYEAVEREASAIPGVRSAALGSTVPLDGWEIGQAFEIVGQPHQEEAKQPAAHYQMVGVRYFETLGIPLMAGRAFESRDNANSTPVCIVNEEFARRYLKDRDPLGAFVSISAMDMRGPTPVTRQVVGVSRQVKVDSLGEPENAVEVYVPIQQNPWYSASLSIKAEGDPVALTSAVREAVRKVDKDLPVTRIRTMEQVTAEAVAEPRFRATLLGTFALLAITLAAAGIFGVLAFSVSQRTREFGIRMALGADSGQVLRMVAGGALKITGIGVLLGLAGAAILTRALSTFLFGVKPLDLVTFLATPAILAVVGLIASLVPAMRASHVDPAVALRDE